MFYFSLVIVNKSERLIKKNVLKQRSKTELETNQKKYGNLSGNAKQATMSF